MCELEPASLLSLSVCDYVILRGRVWSSDGIPLLFDHKTLGVLSVRMECWAFRQNTGCWDTLPYRDTHTHNNTCHYLKSRLNPCSYTLQWAHEEIHLTHSWVWISFMSPEAMLRSGWIFNTCDTKTKELIRTSLTAVASIMPFFSVSTAVYSALIRISGFIWRQIHHHHFNLENVAWKANRSENTHLTMSTPTALN